MALRNVLILRCLAKRGLEGRTVLLQPTRNSFTPSEGEAVRSAGPGASVSSAPLAVAYKTASRWISI